MAKKKPFVLNSNTRKSEQKKVHKKITKDKVCPFCWEHFMKYHTKPIIEKNKNWLITKNAWPYEGSKEHLLVVNKRHVEHVSELNDEEWFELKKIVQKYSIKNAKNGGTFLMRFGDGNITGATVTHLHAHLIVGSKNKKGSVPLKVVIGFKDKK